MCGREGSLQQIPLAKLSRANNIGFLWVMRQISGDEDGLTEFCYLIEFSVRLIFFKENINDWVWDDRNTVFNERIKHCIYFPFAELELGIVKDPVILRKNSKVIADCEFSCSYSIQNAAGVASWRPCG